MKDVLVLDLDAYEKLNPKVKDLVDRLINEFFKPDGNYIGGINPAYTIAYHTLYEFGILIEKNKLKRLKKINSAITDD